ncbi:hypothetical protein F4782DRAFT_534123 [Xylaria castorea]|nr:hypothetical protein F4782DRAFT_534123 [Xylaria castorea]
MAQDDEAPPRLRGPPPGATEPPDHVKQPQIYEVFNSSTTPERSHIAASAAPPAGAEGQQGRPHRATFKQGMQTITSGDFFRVHQIPCAREGFMTGIGAGVAVGAGRYIVGARAPRAANWAFGAFILGSVIQWEYCQAQKRKQRAAMARVVEVMDRKQAEKSARAAEAARLRQEGEEKAHQEDEKRWNKFW